MPAHMVVLMVPGSTPPQVFSVGYFLGTPLHAMPQLHKLCTSTEQAVFTVLTWAKLGSRANNMTI